MRQLLLVTMTGLLVAGCGGDDNNASTTDTAAARGYDSPVPVVQAYVDAFGSGDYAAACDLVDAEAMEKITQTGKITCEEVYEKGGADIETTQKEFDGAKVGDPQITDDRGSVSVTTKSGKEIQLPVVIENGEWKVAS